MQTVLFRRFLPMLFACAALIHLLTGSPRPAEAHLNTIGYSDISIAGNEIKYALFLDPKEAEQWVDTKVRKSFVLAKDGASQAASAASWKQDELEALVSSNLSVTGNAQAGQFRVAGAKLEKRGETDFMRIDLTAAFDRPVQNYEIKYQFFFDSIDPSHQNFATVHANGGEASQVLNKDARVIAGQTAAAAANVVQVAVPNWLMTFWTYTVMGFEHILTGYDHLLFLFGLIVLRQTRMDYLKIISAFTAGHCITLALSALDVVTVSFRMIEPLIALSIVYVALENLLAKKQLSWRWAVAGLFGLIHGFGFSDILRGALGEDIVWSLFSFNLGVELGQLAVLAVMLPLLWVLGRRAWYPRMMAGVSGIIGGLGFFWFVERIIGG